MNLNEILNGLSSHRIRACYKCGRKYPETILNVEGVIHHNMPYQCLKTKSCNRAKRKAQDSQGV